MGVLVFLFLVRGILLPFIVSFIIAALLEPSVRKLRLRGVSRKLAVMTVMAAFFVVVIGIGVVAAPSIARQVTALTTKVEDLTADMSRTSENDNFFLRWNPVVQVQQDQNSSQIDRLLSQYSPTLERFGLPTTRRAIMEQYVDPRRPQIVKAVQSAFNSFFGILGNLFSQILFVVIVPILVPMILMDMDDLKRRGPKWIPPAFRATVMAVINDIGQVFVKYLRGISLVVLLFATVQTLIMVFMGVPYAFLFGILFGALYLIPYIGNIISCVVLFFTIGLSNATGNFLFNTSSPWVYASLVTVMFLAVGFIFDHLIYPQMVGNSVGLNPVVSMFVIFCGGALFGLPGMLIAFPLAGSVKIILDRLLKITSVTGDNLALPSVPLRHRSAST